MVFFLSGIIVLYYVFDCFGSVLFSCVVVRF